MRLARIAVIALLVVTLVATVACSSSLTPTPTASPMPTLTSAATPTPTATPSQEEVAYNSARDEINDAITAYTATYNGYFPVQICYIDGKGISIINMARLVIVSGDLKKVPDGCYQGPGERDDNCDHFDSYSGVIGCSAYNHYIWGINDSGVIYSICVGNDCWSNTVDGYQGVWP
ncbi:MAG: hypothetical protein WC455_03460 [Dehalococcoidia bacterium]